MHTCFILIEMSLKFIPWESVNKPAWVYNGRKPLSEKVMEKITYLLIYSLPDLDDLNSDHFKFIVHHARQEMALTILTLVVGIFSVNETHDVDLIDWFSNCLPRQQNDCIQLATRTAFVIQNKICAEYRDMLPRARLVCQEPGLRPIGRSPGVPDKSSRGLGSISRYSAQILISFIAYIFQFFIPLSLWFERCRTVSMHIVHCNHEAGHQIIKAPSMPCWSAAGPSTHSLPSMPQTGEIDR